MLKLFLQRTRFNLRNLFAKKIVIPTNFKSFEYTNPNYHQLLASYLLSNTDDKINYSKKIFGKETDDLVTSRDIFSEKDKLARFNPENMLLQNVNHDEDIIILEDVGHFPYFESPEETNKALISIIKK